MGWKDTKKELKEDINKSVKRYAGEMEKTTNTLKGIFQGILVILLIIFFLMVIITQLG